MVGTGWSGWLISCRKTIHSRHGTLNSIGGLILGFPALPFGDGGEDDPCVQLRIWCGVGPHKLRLLIGPQHVASAWRTTAARSARCRARVLPDH